MTVYLDLDDLLAAADAVLAPMQPAIRDLGLLESALARPQATAFGMDAYGTLYEKAAALMESLARNHALIDGNERLAWTGTRLFLAMNDTDITVPDPKTADEFVRDLAQGKRSVAEIAATLASWSWSA